MKPAFPTRRPDPCSTICPKKDRSRLQNLSLKPTESAEASTSAPPAPLPPVDISIPVLDPTIARAALRGFQPFGADPPKQARYTAYIQSKPTPPLLLSTQTLPTVSLSVGGGIQQRVARLREVGNDIQTDEWSYGEPIHECVDHRHWAKDHRGTVYSGTL